MMPKVSSAFEDTSFLGRKIMLAVAGTLFSMRYVGAAREWPPRAHAQGKGIINPQASEKRLAQPQALQSNAWQQPNAQPHGVRPKLSPWGNAQVFGSRHRDQASNPNIIKTDSNTFVKMIEEAGMETLRDHNDELNDHSRALYNMKGTGCRNVLEYDYELEALRKEKSSLNRDIKNLRSALPEDPSAPRPSDKEILSLYHSNNALYKDIFKLSRDFFYDPRSQIIWRPKGVSPTLLEFEYLKLKNYKLREEQKRLKQLVKKDPSTELEYRLQSLDFDADPHPCQPRSFPKLKRQYNMD